MKVEGGVTLPSGLVYQDLVEGQGARAGRGDRVSIRFRAILEDGMPIPTLEEGSPHGFTIDMGEVIPGLEEGVIGMRVGGRRKIVVPPELGYRGRGAGDLVPPNATLVFEVELVGISPGPEEG